MSYDPVAHEKARLEDCSAAYLIIQEIADVLEKYNAIVEYDWDSKEDTIVVGKTCQDIRLVDIGRVMDARKKNREKGK